MLAAWNQMSFFLSFLLGKKLDEKIFSLYLSLSSLFKNLRKIINDLDEMNDLYMSDIKKLNMCFYDIGNEFLLDNSAYWNYEDPDADDAEE